MTVIQTSDELRDYIRGQNATRQPISAGKVKKILLGGLETETTFFSIHETEELIHFDDVKGRYLEDGQRRVREYCEAVIRNADAVSCANSHIIEEVENHIRRNNYIDMSEFDSEPLTLIPLENGILDIETLELLPYSKEHRFIKTLGVAYKPEAKCPNFERVLDDICMDNEMKLDLKMRKTIIQLFGYCLWRSYPIQNLFFFIGGGANAKGTILGALQAYLGNDNVANRSVTSLSDNRFAGADLYRKHANISNELTVNEVKNVDLLKSLVSGTDHITAEKKFKQSFNFLSYAKIVIATNAPPKTNDASDGFYRRLNLLRFSRQFLGKDDKKELKELVKQPEELSGILNLALVELKEWMNGCNFKPDADFANHLTVDEIRELYERMSDTVASFRYDAVEITSEVDDVVAKDELYRTYLNYCRMKKIAARTEVWFWRDWREQTIGQTVEKRVGPEKTRSYTGILINDEFLLKNNKNNKIGLKSVNSDMYSPPLDEIVEGEIEQSTKIHSTFNTLEKKRIRFKKDISAWVGADGVTYHSKLAGEIDEIPEKEAEWLIQKEIAEEVLV